MMMMMVMVVMMMMMMITMMMVVRVPPRRVINPALGQKLVVQDFVAYVPNTHHQFPLNSLLFGKGRQAYIVAVRGHREVSS
jgi:hypothetical protein